MRIIRTAVLAWCVVSLVGCASHQPNWPQHVYEGIWIPKQAKNIRYSYEGIYKVFYDISVCYPAKELIDEIVKVMTSRGWTRLESDPLRAPEKIPLNHSRTPSDQWNYGLDIDYGRVYGWKESWQDRKGNIVSYALKYKPAGGEAIETTCSLAVYTNYMSQDSLERLIKAFQETPVAVPKIDPRK